MTIKTIAVPLFSTEEAEWLAPSACDLVRALDAHLIGVHASEPPVIHSGMGAEATVYAEVLRWHEEDADAIGKTLEAAARGADVASEFRARKADLLGHEEFLLSSLRGADLLVMAPSGGDSHVHMRQQIVRQSGRPVLVLPKDVAMAGAPKRILVGWSDTRESARAAHDALTMAAPGAEIQLLSVHHKARARRAMMDSRGDFAAALDRLGFEATLVDRDAESGETATALISAATDFGADLIVAGAFGHSQLYDFVIGAVSTQLMEDTPIPVLLSK